MLYYVKSDTNYTNTEIRISESNQEYKVRILVDNLEGKSSNELDKLVFSFDQKTSDGIYLFRIEKSERGRKTKLNDIVRESGLPVEVVKKLYQTL